VFVVLVAMERLDGRSCTAFPECWAKFDITSDQYDMYQLVSILHRCPHDGFPPVTTASSPACPGWCPRRHHHGRAHPYLMHERGHRHLLMEVNQPDLESRLLRVLETLCRTPMRSAKGSAARWLEISRPWPKWGSTSSGTCSSAIPTSRCAPDCIRGRLPAAV